MFLLYLLHLYFFKKYIYVFAILFFKKYIYK